MKGQILYISKHATAASTRYRILQFIEPLEAEGWHSDYHSANQNSLKDKWQMIQKAKEADVVILQRKLLDRFTFGSLRRAAKKLVFDFDDAIFLNSDGSDSAVRQRRFDRITEAADLVLAGNQYLADASKCSNNVVLPTVVPLSRCPDAEQLQENIVSRATQEQLRLVWIGSHSTSRYLEAYRETLEAIGAAYPEIQLRIIGDFEIAFDGLNTECISWTEAGEIKDLLEADIGIAPMVDDPWTRGKCALKVIQYMACGLPVISSDCGANREVIQEGETGFLCRTTEDWLSAINRLKDARKRLAMGLAGRERMAKQFSLESAVELLDSELTRLTNS